MSCDRPLDVDRYRKLKDKGLVSPRVGAAVVTFSPSTEEHSRGPTTPNLAYQPGMVPLASPYRDAPPTPLLNQYGCGNGLLAVGKCTNDQQNTTATGSQKQLTVSLFEEGRRQRYEKFKNKMRESQSPKNNNNSSSNNNNHNRPPSALKHKSTTIIDTVEARDDSVVDLTHDKYTLRKSDDSRSELQTDDKYAFPRGRDFAASEDSRSGRDARNISPSKQSAFRNPKSHHSSNNRKSPGRKGRSTTPKSRYFKNVPSPPSVTEVLSTSNHPMNSVGLPIASARHGPSTPKESEVENKLDLPSVVKVHDARRPSSTPLALAATGGLPVASQWRSKSREKQRGYQPKLSVPRGHGGAPRPEGPSHENRSSSRGRPKPSLAVDTSRYTPTSKTPGIAYSYSSERGVTPPPSSSRKTPVSLAGSESTSSSVRRDRILESRGIVQDDDDDVATGKESREPLNDMYRSPVGRFETNVAGRQQNPTQNLQRRSSLDLPSLKSNSSFRNSSRQTPPKTQQENVSHSENVSKSTTPLGFYKRISAERAQHAARTKQTTPKAQQSDVSDSKNLSRSVTPIDFYKRISAERTQQAQWAKQQRMGGGTPTSQASPQRTTPLFRAESPRSTPVPMLDQRTVRLLYAKDFDALIREHMASHTHAILQQMASLSNSRQKPKGISLFVRKRPLLHDEVVNGEFDVVNAETGQANSIVVYVTSILSDLQTKDIQAQYYEFDHVFAERRQAEDFYLRMAQAGVLRARDGGVSAFVTFGGEGSGKTHCVADIEERAAYDLFETARGSRPSSVSVQYLELSGNHIVDLLGPVGNHVNITEEEGGRFRVRGNAVKSALGTSDLLTIMSDARRRLAGKDGQQGYVLCQISIHQKWSKGSLVILECPTVDFSNGLSGTMLDGLIRGIRARAQDGTQNNAFWGTNAMTKIFRDVLEDPKAHVSVLAAVSPAASCTEETISVLKTLSSIVPGNGKMNQPRNVESPRLQQENDSPTSVNSISELVLPRQWTHFELLEWMGKKNLLGNKMPSDVNGRLAMRMTKQELQNAFYDVVDTGKAEKLYLSLRAENDRVARMRVKIRMARDRERNSSGQYY